MPSVKARALTEPAPFHLETEKRGAVYQSQFTESIQKKVAEDEKLKKFIANPLPDDLPFVPKLSDKPLVVPDDIVLNTDLRAAKRQEFEEMIKRKEEEERITKENQARINMVCIC